MILPRSDPTTYYTMIYQFKDGPLDGDEQHIPEAPIGTIFRYLMSPELGLIYKSGFDDLEPLEARYQVTDIGEMTFDHYEG